VPVIIFSSAGLYSRKFCQNTMDRVKISDIFINNLEWDRIAGVIEKFIRNQKAHQIITANSSMVASLDRDSRLKEAFFNADLVLADSAGIVWASKFLRAGKLIRIPGIDLMLELCRLGASRGYSIYLLGSEESIVKKARENLDKQFPNLRILGMQHGYFSKDEEERIVEQIREAKPDFLFVGIGTPRGEKWIYSQIERLNVPVCMAVGGSLDVIAGRLKRAPRWIRELGFEWTYRIIQEPWRIVRLPALFSFLWKVFKQKLVGNFSI